MSRPDRWLPLVLIAAGLLVYANAFDGPFLYDDESIVGSGRLGHALPDSPVAGRPVVYYSFALNHALGGLDPRGYRALNLAVHIACALLLSGLIRRTLATAGSRLSPHAAGLAFAAALIWIVHPLETECVDYISQRSESIMSMFYLLTLYAARRARDAVRDRAWIALAVVGCALGMASKETMVTAPAMLILYDAVFQGGDPRRELRRRAGLYAGLAATWIVLAGLMAAAPRPLSVGFSLGTGAVDWAKNQCLVVVHYLKLLVWPRPLTFDYGLPATLDLAEVLPQALVLAALLAGALFLLWRRAPIGFAALWPFVLLAPTSSIVPIVTEVGAERRMYLASAGPIVLAVVCGAVLLGRLTRDRRTGIVVLLLVALPLAGATLSRNRDYSSAVSIWRTAVAARPENERAHSNLGRALQQEGAIEEAISHYMLALELRPDYPEALNNLGGALLAAGRPDEAIVRFTQAIEARPAYPSAHYNLATVLQSRGRLVDAVAHYREALRYAPDRAETHNNLGTALGSLGELDAAVEQFREALRIDPHYEAARENLDLALERAAPQGGD